MKKIKILSVLDLVSAVVPWTILIWRQYEFALKSPAAEIIIAAYGIYIVAAFVFSMYIYAKKKIRGTLPGIALVLNGIYLTATVVLVCASIPGWIH
jgi:hypothetical protein